MKSIFTYPILVIAGFIFSLNAGSQNCTTVQPNVGACSNVVEDFNSGAGGFLGTNLAHTSNNFSTVLSNALSPATLSIISPAYYKLGTMPNTVMAGYTIHIGFKVTITSITLQVLNAMNSDAVVASCQQNVNLTNVQTPICISVTSPSITTGMMLKYKFIFVAQIDPGGNNSQNSVSVDEFTTALGQNAPLPVKFGTFDARNNGNAVLLTWNIESEENTAMYQVERSADGKNYKVLASVIATGPGVYHFSDVQPLADAYYRIKAVDLDDKYTYSVVVRVKGRETGTMMKAFWRQKDLLVVQHELSGEGTLIQLLAADGRLISSYSVNPGTQETVVDVTAAKPGLIIVRFLSSQKHEVLKLLKN